MPTAASKTTSQASVAWLVVVLLGGCGGAPPVATAADAARAHVELADLEHGRTLMLGKCSGCHRAPMPADHPGRDWPHWLDEMTDRAKLEPMQRHLIEQYLITMAMH